MKRIGVVVLGGCCGYAIHKYQGYKEEVKIQKVAASLNRVRNIKSRNEQISLSKVMDYDLLVIGGGATGSGVALDAATRGLKVALIEKEDFGAGTSTRSTKLIHGGVRYLENAVKSLDIEQFMLVKEALSERAKFLSNAPHVTSKIPIMIPIYSWWQLPYYWAGVKMYDLVAGSQNLESSYFLSKSRALTEFPMLRSDKLVGALVYYDGQQNDARTNVMLACTAASFGATVINHLEVMDLKKDKNQKVSGVIVKDEVTGESWEIRGKGVVNACGPFSDRLRKMDDPTVEDIVVPSAGVHVVLPNYYSPQNMGLLDPATSDGRVIFFLPWNNNTLAGTTDTLIELTERPEPLEQEIHWILKEISNYLSPDISVQRGDVLAAWSGIRPLVRDPNRKDTKSFSRSHVLEVSKSGLLTIAGGKWTTYRKMAEDTVDKAIETFGLKPLFPFCLTSVIKINGGETYSPTLFIKLIQQYGIDKRAALHLIHSYGDRAFEVASFASPTGRRWPVVGVRLSPAYFFIDAEVRYAIRHEYAVTLIDIIARRTPLAFQNAHAAGDACELIANIAAEELEWTEEKKRKEIEQAKEFLNTMSGDKIKDLKAIQWTSLEVVKWREIFAKLDENHEGLAKVEDITKEMKGIGMDLTAYLKRWGNQEKINFGDFLEVLSYYKNVKPTKKIDVTIERSGGGI